MITYLHSMDTNVQIVADQVGNTHIALRVRSATAVICGIVVELDGSDPESYPYASPLRGRQVGTRER